MILLWGISFVVGVIVFLLWGWMVVDCLLKETHWGKKLLWLFIIVVIQPIGFLLYALIRRPERMAENQPDGAE